jgi:uncharacterized protein (DUF1330 family)
MPAFVVVQHRVRDYRTWKPVFEEHGAVRAKHGAKGHVLYRTLDDPNNLVVVTEFSSPTGAKAFMADPSLPEAMKQAGVEMPAAVYLCEELEKKNY